VRQKHVPQRICIACRQPNPKRGLVRVVRDTAGGVVVDTTGKANGRGAYVCQQYACWQHVLERGTLAAALRVPTITEEDREALIAFARTIESAT
jgi:predicted RNA-binding protein YlxR (DUF448 family)